MVRVQCVKIVLNSQEVPATATEPGRHHCSEIRQKQDPARNEIVGVFITGGHDCLL